MAVVGGIGYAAYWHEGMDTADRAKRAWKVSSDAFQKLPQQLAYKQAKDLLRIDAHNRLLLTSVGALLVEDSPDNQPKDTVLFRQFATESIGPFPITRAKTGAINRNRFTPPNAARLTVVLPRFVHPSCDGSTMKVDAITFDVGGVHYSAQNPQLPGQCGNGNGLGGQQVTVHGQPYPEISR